MKTFIEPTDLDPLQALIDDLKAQLALKTQQLADATNLLSTSCDSRFATMQTSVNTNTTSVTSAQTTVSQLQTTVNQQATTITNNNNTITSLQSTISANQTTINNLNATIWRLSIANAPAANYVPLYSWNCAGYDQVVVQKQKYPHIPIIAAINPASGPGTSKSATIANAVNAMQNAGIVVLGYVGTNYGSELTKRQYPVGNPWPSDTPNTLADVEGRCLSYQQWYSVDGYMFDDFSNTQTITLPDSTTKDVYNTFYVPLFTYARGLPGIRYIKGNMGTKPLYMPLADLCDNVCVYEGSANPSLATIQNNTYNGRLRNKASVVVNTITTLDQTAMVTCNPYAKYYYSSNAGYNAVPTYYDALMTTLVGL